MNIKVKVKVTLNSPWRHRGSTSYCSTLSLTSALSSRPAWTDWPFKTGRIGSPETSVSNHLTPRNDPEGGRIEIKRISLTSWPSWATDRRNAILHDDEQYSSNRIFDRSSCVSVTVRPHLTLSCSRTIETTSVYKEHDQPLHFGMRNWNKTPLCWHLSNTQLSASLFSKLVLDSAIR